MKGIGLRLGMLLCVFLIVKTMDAAPVVTCEELSQETQRVFKRMDDAIKLKSGLLLGEMETAKGALDGCILENKAVNMRISLIWFLTDLGLLVSFTMLLLHQRRMKKGFAGLSLVLHSYNDKHPLSYSPSRALYRSALLSLGLTFLILNAVALFL